MCRFTLNTDPLFTLKFASLVEMGFIALDYLTSRMMVAVKGRGTKRSDPLTATISRDTWISFTRKSGSKESVIQQYVVLKYLEQNKINIIPFIGKQLDICRAFRFDIPKESDLDLQVAFSQTEERASSRQLKK